MFFRFPGAIVGFLIGSLIDGFGKGTTTFTYNKSPEVSPADFELNLLSLCALVIKADGQVSSQEMQMVQNYFVQSYGKERANATFRTFNEVVKTREIAARPICERLRMRTRYESRLQIIHFLFNIAQADGNVSTIESDKIREIAGFLAINF